MIAVPPSEEQHAIVDRINEETADLKWRRFEVAERNRFAQEFRARLIADVVTGKLDVRAAAAAARDRGPRGRRGRRIR